MKKVFGKITAVDGVSFNLKQGEILGFLGPNGAGKTTTIQMLLGVLTPTSGKVEYFGKNLRRNRSEILGQVNFSSTYTRLPDTLTVKENLTWVAFLYDIPSRKQRVEDLIKTFHLQELAGKKMVDLSAGQVTRVNLAKAFINTPKVLLLDEPTASLDPEVAAYIRKFLLLQQKQSGISILLTSHNMAEVEEICDRVIFINRGRIIADDTPEVLTRSIEIAHVQLLITAGSDKFTEYCQAKKINFRQEGRSVIVDVNEKQLPVFLRGIMKAGVIYGEISIEKPDLEDYFLQVAGQQYFSENEEV